MSRQPGTKRPVSRRTPAVEEQIIEGLAAGRGLGAIAKELGLARGTLRFYEASDPAFAERCRIARLQGYEKWAEEILEIAESVRGSTCNAAVQAARLECDSRKWLLSKLHPEQFGERVELTGKDGRDLIPVDVEHHALPRLLVILHALLPGSTNSELHALALTMVRKLKRLEDDPDTQPIKVLNGTSDTEH